MKLYSFKIFSYFALALMLFALLPHALFATVFTSSQTGDWRLGTTWGGACGAGCTAGTDYPGSTDTAIVATGHTVTLTADQTVAQLTVSSASTLDNANKTMTITGKIIINGTFVTGAANGLVLSGTNTDIDGLGIVSGATGITISTAGKSILSSANLTVNGKFTVNSGLTLTNYGVITILGDLNGGGATSTWINEANANLITQGGKVMDVGILIASASENTVEYNRSTPYNIAKPKDSTFYNLKISGNGTKNLQTFTIVKGDLTITGTLDCKNYNIQIAGNWSNSGTFEEGTGTVIFNGSGSQSVTNILGETFYNLTNNKALGTLTLNNNVTVSNTLTMTQGNINTGSATLTLGTTCGSNGTYSRSSGTIIGKFERWLDSGTTGISIDFPVGTASKYCPAAVTFNTIATCGSLIGEFKESDPAENGLPLDDGTTPDSIRNTFVEGYWTYTTANGFASSDYNLQLTGNGFTSFTINSATRLLTRVNAGSNWTVNGSHVAATGSTAKRDNITTLSAQYCFGDTSNCSGPTTSAITGSDSVCVSAAGVSYSVVNTLGSIYTWTITGGAVASGQGTNAITVNWDAAGMVGNVSVTENNGCTNGNPVNKSVNIHTLPTSAITGNNNVIQFSTASYSVTSRAGYTYTWTITGGTQASGGTTGSITVDWGTAGAGNVRVEASTGCNAADPVNLPVTINGTIISIATGNWNVGSTWNCACVPSSGDNVTIDSSDIVTLVSNPTTINSVTIYATGTLDDGAMNSITITGDFIVDGTYTGAKDVTLSGIGTVSLGGTGIISNTGKFVLNGGNVNILSSANLTISSASEFSFEKAGITVNNYGTITIASDIKKNGAGVVNWVNEENSTLNIAGSIDAAGNLTASAAGNTVNYNKTAAQTVNCPTGGQYYHLKVSGASGTKSLACNIDVDGNLTIDGSALLDVTGSNYSITLAGNWINNSDVADPFIEQSGLVTFDGSSAQSITNTGGESFYNLTVDKPSDTLTINDNVTVSSIAGGTLTMNSGNIKTGADTLKLGTSCANYGALSRTSGTVAGRFQRFINATGTPPPPVLLPIGTAANYRPASITFNTLSTCGSIVGEFVVSSPGVAGLALFDVTDSIFNTSSEGYWDIKTANSLASPDYNLECTGNGFTSLTITAGTRLLTRADAGSNWTVNGSHVAASGSTAKRNNITTLSAQYTFGDTAHCAVPVTSSITGTDSVCTDQLGVDYSVTNNSPNSYLWSIRGGGGAIASGQGTNQITVNWGSTGKIDTVRVVESSNCGNGSPVDFEVTIHTLPTSAITGKSAVSENTTGEPYSVTNNNGYIYDWYITGGTKASGDSSSSITVNWGAAGAGKVEVVARTQCDTVDTVSISVTIYASIISIATGNWTTTSTWNCFCVPDATDNVIIDSSHTVSLTNDTVINNIEIYSTGAVNNAGYQLTVTGNYTMSGTHSGTGNIILNGSGTTINGTGTITNTGVLQIDNNKSILAGTNITKSGGNVTLGAATTVTNSGNITLGAGLTGTDASTSIWTNSSNSTLNIGGALLATGVLNASASGNTVGYNGSGAQTIKCPNGGQYYNLTSCESGAKTLECNIDVNGNLQICGASQLDVSASNYTINIAGNWSNTSSNADPFVERSGTVTFDGATTQSINEKNYYMLFDAVNEDILIGNTSVLNFTGSFSVAAWINTASLAATQDIIFRSTSSPYKGYAFDILTSGKLILIINGASVTTSSTVLAINTWYHVGVSKISGATPKIYVNGVETAYDNSSNVNPTSNIANARVGGTGGIAGWAGRQFNGKIDEPTFWNSALSAAQFLELYNIGVSMNSTVHSASANIMWYGRMGDAPDSYDGTNWTIVDQSVNINNGTSTNMEESDRINRSSMETYYNMTINKLGGTLTQYANVNVSNTLTMTQGNINTLTDTLILGTSTANVGTLTRTSGTVIGRYKKWKDATPGAITFPVGTSSNYRPGLVTFTNITAGSLTGEFVASAPGNNGLTLADGAFPVDATFTEGYWSFTAASSLASTDYDLELTGNGFTSYTISANTRILKRATSSDPWSATGWGTHIAANVATSTAKRDALSSISDFDFSLGDTSACPGPTTSAITGPDSVCTNDTAYYSVTDNPPNTYTWTLLGGTIISGQGTDSIRVAWGSTGMIGNVRVIETDACTNGAAVDNPVKIHILPTSSITGTNLVAENDTGEIYFVTNNLGYTYTWSILGDSGTITSGQGTNSITVNWLGKSNDTLQVTASTGCGSVAPVIMPVTIRGVIVSITTGDWTTAATWDCNCVPTASDDAVIDTGDVVTLTANTTITSITIRGGGGTLNNSTFTFAATKDYILNGTHSGSGAINLTGAGTYISGTGSVTNTNIFRVQNGNKTILSGTNLTITPAFAIQGDYTVTNNGSMTLQGNLTGSSASSKWLNGANSTLKIAGILLATGDLNADSSGNTVEYNGSGDQTIKAVSYPLRRYCNLILSGGGTKTLAANTKVGCDLTISGVTFDVSASNYTLEAQGNWINNGTFNARSNTVIFSGTTTISGSSTTSFNNVNVTATLTGASADTFNVAGNWTNTGTFNHNEGTVTFNGTTTVSGASLTNFNNVTISGTLTGHATDMGIAGNWVNNGTFTHNSGTVTFNDNTTLSGASTSGFNNVTVTDSLTGVSAGNFNVAGNWTDNGTFIHNNGTVTFNGTTAAGGTSTTNFENVTISGTLTGHATNMGIAGNWINNGTFTHNSGTVTFNGNTTLSGASASSFNHVTISDTLTGVSAGNFNVAGNWSNAGVFTHNSGTVTINGAGTQSITNTSGETYYNLTVNKSADTLTINDNVTANNAITMSLGNIKTGTDTLTLGTACGNTGTLTRTAGTVVGRFERWINTTGTYILFPIGTAGNYRPALLNFDACCFTSCGSLVGEFIATSPGVAGLPLGDNGDSIYQVFTEGYWAFNTPNTLSSADYDVKLTGNGFVSHTINDSTRVLTRPNAAANWAIVGTHVLADGDTAKRATISTDFPSHHSLGDTTTCAVAITSAITGLDSVCTSQTGIIYSVTNNSPNSYTWAILDGGGTIVSGQGTNSITVDWGASGKADSIRVVERSNCGNSAPVYLAVDIHSIPPASIAGKNAAGQFTSSDYSVTARTGYTYFWTITGGTINSGQNTDSITVDWGGEGAGNVRVQSVTGCDTSSPVDKPVIIYVIVTSVQTGDWDTASTWDCNCVPLVTDKAIIDSTDTVTLTQNTTIKNIDIRYSGVLNNNGNPFTVTADYIVNGTHSGTGNTYLTGAMGDISGIGTITNTDSMVITGTKIILTGTNLTKATGAVSISAGDTVTNNGSITIGGNIVGGDANTNWINAVNSTLNTGGALLSAGSLTASATGNTVNFNGSAAQPVICPNGGQYYHLTTSGSGIKTLQCNIDVNGNLTISGSCRLDVSGSNYSVNLASNWVDTSSDADPFIQQTGTVTLDGSSAQSITATIGETFYNLTFNKPTDTLTLNDNVTVSNILTMTKGNVKTGTDTLTLGTSTANTGTLTRTEGTVIGRFERWINTTGTYILYPVGTASNYRPGLIKFTDLTNGSLVGEFVATAPGNNGVPIDDGAYTVDTTFTEGYWSFAVSSSLASTDYDINLIGNGFTSFTMSPHTRILKRTDSGNPWTLDGAHVSAVGDTAKRSELSNISDFEFSLGDTSACKGPTTSAITGQDTVCSGVTGIKYSVTSNPANTYNWTVLGSIASIASGATNDTVTIDYAATPGFDTIRVVETDACSVRDSSDIRIAVSTLPTSAITGDPVIAENTSGEPYSVTNIPGYVYTWAILGDSGTVASGQGTNSITVNWLGANDDTLRVIADAGCSDDDTVYLAVQIYSSIISIATGGWDTPATWQCTCVPAAANSVIIDSGHTVTVNTNGTTISTVTIYATATLTNAAGISFNVTGDYNLFGTHSGAGAINLNGAGVSINGTGSITNTGLLRMQTGNKTIVSTANLTVSSSDVGVFAGTVVTSNGTVVLTGNLALIAATSEWKNDANSTLKVAGAITGTATGTFDVASGDTVEYNGGADQTVVNPTFSRYSNLVLSNAGTKTIDASFTTLDANGSIIIKGAAVFASNNKNITVAGNWVNNSSFTAGTGTVTFDGATTVSGSTITSFNNVTTGTGFSLTGHSVNMNVAGNWNNSGTFAHNNGKVTFNGASAQTITKTGGETYYDLIINNTSTGVTLNNPVAVVDSLGLNDGNIISTAANLLTLNDNARSDSGSINSFVGGPMRKIGNDAFVFPVGDADSTVWARLGISAPSLATTEYTAQYFSKPYSDLTVDASLYNVSVVEYWTLTQAVNDDDIRITLYWEDTSRSGITDYTSTDLRIARFNGTSWQDTGQFAITSANPGNVTSSVVANYSPFTFASKSSSLNPLPVELLFFDAILNGDRVDLTWATSSETNNDYFTVEKSSDAVDFAAVTEVPGAGTSTEVLIYEAVDWKPYKAISYYRLKQTDYDGVYKYSKRVAINNGGGSYNINIYPNPSQKGENIFVELEGLDNKEILVVLMDVLGREYYSKIIVLQDGQNLLAIDTSGNLAPGVYMITASNQKDVLTKRKIVIK